MASTIRIGTARSIYFIFFGGVISKLEHREEREIVEKISVYQGKTARHFSAGAS
jgi:hypothetical protein